MAERFVAEAVAILTSSTRTLMDNEFSNAVLETEENRLTALYRNVRRMATAYPDLEEFGRIFLKILNDIEVKKRSNEGSVVFQAPRVAQTGGRPLYIISREQLNYLTEMGFTTTEMANLLHVSKSVVKRRLRTFNISLRTRYSNISDEDLDAKIREITQNNQSLGQRLVQGMLSSEGIHVQRQRVADSLVRVDEAGVAMRWCRAIHRRVYRVSGPNALWHIDGNHKLVRWGFVIHGGIYGFSRLVSFLAVATNNKAESMTKAFMTGCRDFGVPSRVRSDHGLENVGVGAFMLSYRGPRRGSFITGRSVHNQRIERLWRDMFQSCTGVFHRLFHYLEETGQLDISDDTHLWALQYVYQPRIQRALNHFQQAWNNHRLRTEAGRSPRQLFVRGILEQLGQGQRGIDDLVYEPPLEPQPEDLENYGVDLDGPIPEIEENPEQLSAVPCPLTLEQLERLRLEVDPLIGNGLGVDLYNQTLNLCRSM